MWWFAIICLLSALPGSAFAGENVVRLKPGPGLDKVEAYCGACHSLDYIVMNSPFLTAAQWEAAVTKMTKSFGAPIDATDGKAISDYLARNYGG